MDSSFFNLAFCLASVAVISSIVAIVLSMILHTKLNKRISELKEHIERNDAKNRTMMRTVSQDSSKFELSTENFNFIVETVIQAVEDNLAKKKLSAPESDIPKESAHKYASAYNVKERTFYRVEDNAFDETIYEIAINAESCNSGTFTIFKPAYRKVTGCPAFLEGACRVIGSGHNMNIIEDGTVSLQEGKWVIEHPLKVEFI